MTRFFHEFAASQGLAGLFLTLKAVILGAN
jgi:hypothetical protein